MTSICKNPKIYDWHSMNADQMPASILALFSSSGETWQAKKYLMRYFHRYIESPEEYKQALETDVAVLATPFFVELLRFSESDKVVILDILDALAAYRQATELETLYRARAENIYQYLLRHFDFFMTFIESEDVKQRIGAMYLVSNFREFDSVLVDVFLSLLETQKEEDVFAKQVIAEIIYKKLGSQEKLDILNRFLHIMRSWIASPHEVLAVQATAAYYLIQKGQIDSSTIDTLFKTLIPPLDADFSTVIYDYLNVLISINYEGKEEKLIDALKAQDNPWIIFTLAYGLLATAFLDDDVPIYDANVYGNKAIIDVDGSITTLPESLNSLQKKILSAIFDKSEIWQFETNLFSVFSLPNQRQTLIELLKK